MPTLEESDGTILYESLIVAEYLDSKYPGERPLLPADPYERAVQKQLVEAVIQTVSSVGKRPVDISQWPKSRLLQRDEVPFSLESRSYWNTA